MTIIDTIEPIRFSVYGLAETQGSKNARTNGTRAWVVDGSAKKAKRHETWRAAVADAARSWQETNGQPGLIADVAVVVHLAFWLPKPASAPRRRRVWPIKARSGDVDKLARSVLDSLTHTIVADDSQVTVLIVTKDFGDPPRVDVWVEPIADDIAEVAVSWQPIGAAL